MTFYHGSSSAAKISKSLLPPSVTNMISEKSRRKNLDRVFFTKDIGLAKIYAGRASKSLGGLPLIYEVTPVDDVTCLSDAPGASVYHASHASVELIKC